jgi:hypothetical protein
MFDDFEIEWGVLAVSLFIWVMILAAVWILPRSLWGGVGYDLFNGITISVVALPLCYFIVRHMANK